MTKRILIVEDDAMISMMLEEYVDLLGFETAGCAESVSTALEKISGGGIDAAIVDIRLSDGDLSEPVAEALAAADIPFVVATGGFIENPAPIWSGRPVVEKPFTIASLREAFEAIE